MVYEALFFNGWDTMPTYYLLDGIEGDTPEQALATNLERITRQVREQFRFGDEMSDAKIQETIYVLRENGLVSAKEVARLHAAGTSGR